MTTNKTINGKDYQVTTMKGYRGTLSTSYQQGTLSNGGFSYSLFGGDDRGTLLTEKKRATKNNIQAQHEEGLILFAEKIGEADDITGVEVYKIEVGQIIFLNGYGQSPEHHKRKAIYEIKKSDFGVNYLTVCLETFELDSSDRIRPVEELFGIGTYYKEGDKISLSEVQEAHSKGVIKRDEKNALKEKQSTEAAEQRAKDIEKGETLVTIPKGAKYVLVAEFMEDHSDSQTDYFHSSSCKRVYLAFSTHKRDLFSEMRKAANNFEEVHELANAPESFEHREKYSMGAGYYLGESKYSGWIIEKIGLTSHNSEEIKTQVLEEMQIAASQDRYFCNESAPTAKPSEMPKEEPAEAGTVKIIEYSERAIAVIGDTKPIKDKLKSLGGRFNFRLTCGAGWIFPKTKLEELKQALAA